MRRLILVWAAAACLAACGAAAGVSAAPSSAPAAAAKSCPPGYVDANLSWGEKCLHAGEFCKVGNPEYGQYGFDCPPDGRLVERSGVTPSATTTTVAPAAAPAVGRTVLLSPRSRARGCRRGALPDRRCSPGAYSSGLTAAVLCSPSFHTSTIRNVPTGEKYAVEREYGMVARPYGRTIEIDHIVSLELGGSNDIANLYPEPGSGAAGYRVKDRLENRLHALVCSGRMTLRAAQRGIAGNWERLYRRVFGAAA